MTTTDDEYGLVRQLAFECDGPVEIDIHLGSGSIDVRLGPNAPSDAPVDETPADEVPADDAAAGDVVDAEVVGEQTGEAGTTDHAAPAPAASIVVEVRYEPRGDDFGLLGLVNWVTGQLGGRNRAFAEQAVEETLIEVHGNRLVVHGPRHMPLRGVPLAISVSAPAGSSLHTRSGSADVRVTGTAGSAHVGTGSGDISLQRAQGRAQVKTGSGTVRLGPMLGGLSARSGSGDLEVAALHGSGDLHSGSGDIWLGSVSSDQVSLRTGSGDLTVTDAAHGRLDLVTGSGDLRIGIRKGVVAELDLLSGSGRTRSELPVSDEPPEGEPALWVRARTGSGEAIVGSATA